MGNLQNLVENTKDYLGNDYPKFVELMKMGDIPDGEEIMTHARMLYGHVDWTDLIVELDGLTNQLLMKSEISFDVGEDVRKRLRSGKHVAILDGDGLGPMTYSRLKTGRAHIELMDLEEAINQAARWFVEDLFDYVGSFPLFIPYFLVAFRLALLDGEIPDDERFSDERLDAVWRNTQQKVMFCVGARLAKQAFEASSRIIKSFHLSEYQVEKYLENR